MGNLNLGIIGNCQISSLIDSSGAMVWACLPRFDGDPVFCRLLRSDQSPDAPGYFDVEIEARQEIVVLACKRREIRRTEYD